MRYMFLVRVPQNRINIRSNKSKPKSHIQTKQTSKATNSTKQTPKTTDKSKLLGHIAPSFKNKHTVTQTLIIKSLSCLALWNSQSYYLLVKHGETTSHPTASLSYMIIGPSTCHLFQKFRFKIPSKTRELPWCEPLYNMFQHNSVDMFGAFLLLNVLYVLWWRGGIGSDDFQRLGRVKLWEAHSISPLKMRASQKERMISQPPIIRGYVSFRQG